MSSSANLECNRNVWKGGNVYLNMDTDANTYYLVCNYCEKALNFSNFNDFLTHAREKHGPFVETSAENIVQENEKNPKTSATDKEEERHICSSGRLPADKMLPAPARQSSSLPLYDLKQVKRECLMEIIELLSKCLCIWHKPTRLRTSQKERFSAYQLLLLKLRKYHPECCFKNVRSIVRQLITSYFSEHTRSGIEQDEDENDDGKSTLEKNPIHSQTVIKQLMFLAKSDTKDEEKLNIRNHCSFCGRNFSTISSLWTHMVDVHTPQKASNVNSPTVSCSSCITVDYDDLISKPVSRINSPRSSTTSRGRRRKSNSTVCSNSECDTDFYTENSESDYNERPKEIRKSKRKRKRCRRRINEPHEKRRRVIDLTSDTDVTDVTDVSNLDLSPSTYFLSDYDDKFLEEFIDLYRQQKCLWQISSSTYRSTKLRNRAYGILLEKYRNDRDATTGNILQIKKLIKSLRNYYNQLKKPNANLYRSHIWKKLSFLEDCHSSKSLISGDGDFEYHCNHCQKKFKRKRFVSIHQLRRHAPTECIDCSEDFGNADDLKKHILWFHRKDTLCPLCKSPDDDWKSSQHLAEHFYDNICRTCGEIFHDINNFHNHKIKCYAKNRFKCWHCDAAFRGSAELRKHSKDQHNDERPFKCSYCELTFKFLAPLLKHLNVHKRLKHF